MNKKIIILIFFLIVGVIGASVFFLSQGDEKVMLLEEGLGEGLEEDIELEKKEIIDVDEKDEFEQEHILKRLGKIKNVLDLEKEISKEIDDLRKFSAEKEDVGYKYIEGAGGRELHIAAWKINYDKNDILSISLWLEGYGPYPVDQEKNYSFDLSTGEIIKITDIIYEEKISELIRLANEKLKDNIKNSRNYAKIIAQESLEWFDEQVEGTEFTRENFENFKIDKEGINFYYYFEFPHAVREIEPLSLIEFSFNEIKTLLNKKGLLGYKK